MRTLLPALLAFAPGSAAACAVCFGGTAANKGLFDGFWWAIVLLISTVMVLVSAIGYALYRVEKNREAAEARA